MSGKDNLCHNEHAQNKRYFTINKKFESDSGFGQITTICGSSSTMMIPIDIDEDGKMDLLV